MINTKIKLVNKKVSDLLPYENNPRNNDEAVAVVANSISEFGFKVPIIVNSEGVIIAGHTRLKAAQKLGLEEVPVIIADDLSDEQVKAFRLADNKVSEFAQWDFVKLEKELANIDSIDLESFGFKHLDDIEWAEIDDLSEDTYEEPKKTYLRCPHCGHVDTTTHFLKVNMNEDNSEDILEEDS